MIILVKCKSRMFILEIVADFLDRSLRLRDTIVQVPT